ncbi:MAG: hypothetical protein JNM10_14965 [Planctomycetia bacterium]|nr:hypothetical protein [Planctomycetia bacterium]
MADLTVTASQVKAGAGAVEGTGVAGTTVTAGQPVYEDATDGRIKLADSNLSLAAAKARGVALHGALANQPIRYQKGGKVILGAGAAPVKGTIYVASATAGGIAPAADLVSGWHATILGVGDGDGGLDLVPGGPFASGHAVP